MRDDRTSVFNKRFLTDQDAYTFYKNGSKKRQIKNTPTLGIYRKIIVSFYKKIGEKMIEEKGGVFIGGFGYFVLLLNPIRKIQKPVYKKNSFYLNAHSDSRVYHPCFIPMTRNYNMRFFVMDRAFTENVRSLISKKIISGHKYRNHFGLLLSLFRKNKKYD